MKEPIPFPPNPPARPGSHSAVGVDSEGADSEGDPVGDLVRGAGRRSPIPSAAEAQVRTAAFEQWQATVRLERRRRLWWRSGGLLAAAASLLAVVQLRQDLPVSAPGPQWVLESASGPVWLLDFESDSATELEPGATLPAGKVVETRGDGESTSARALFRLAGGSTLRLDAETRFGLDAESRLRLESGAVYIDTGDTHGGAAERACCEVWTERGSVRHIGTQFEVRTDAETPLRVRVRQGEVEYRPSVEGRAPVRATAGRQLAVDAAGRAEISALEAPDAWDWLRQIPPAFAIEGRSLHELLEWASQEAGWRLDYTSPEARRRAEAVRLHGTIEGLGLEDALALAFLGSGSDLRFEIDGAGIHVSVDEGV